ncbi:hypothetical protein KAI12_05320 [Candidatus Bathyarchaeota archaeon]|nr:hypothetical protein [Candidatus Bathyarchaeota archaeon]
MARPAKKRTFIQTDRREKSINQFGFLLIPIIFLWFAIIHIIGGNTPKKLGNRIDEQLDAKG